MSKLCMLTLEEILSDVAENSAFKHLSSIDIGCRGTGGETPLHWMATLGDAQAISILLNSGANIDAVDNDGNTPLHEAVLWRQTNAAIELIAAGASVSKRNNAGMTAQDIAKQDACESTLNLFSSLRSTNDQG